MPFHARSLAAYSVFLLLLAQALVLQAQEFDLVASELGLASKATLQGKQLQIQGPDGKVTVYSRDTQYDSADRQWLAFRSSAANQILRWPLTNAGRMQIGTLEGRSVVYRSSQMEIRPGAVARTMQRPVFPPLDPLSPGPVPQVGGLLAELAVSKLFDAVSQRRPNDRLDSQLLRIATTDVRGSPWLLSRGTGTNLSLTTSNNSGTDWFVSPVGNGYVRLQTFQRGNVYAIGSNSRRGLRLMPASQDPHQLWRVGQGRRANQFFLESLAFPGTCLTNTGAGRLGLQPISFTPLQMWSPYAAPRVNSFQPFWRAVNTEILPNSQLPPAKLDLVNTHRYALVIALGDARQGEGFEQFRIEPGQSRMIELERDSGATIVETVEYRTLGGWRREQYVTAVPARSFYDLSVYEEHLQSIAIDATGKSPNRIEDVNYVPKSVGWFPLPAGDAIPASGSIDLYPQAKAAKNPGAVRRLDPEQFNAKPAERPLERLLDKYQSAPRVKF